MSKPKFEHKYYSVEFTIDPNAPPVDLKEIQWIKKYSQEEMQKIIEDALFNYGRVDKDV